MMEIETKIIEFDEPSLRGALSESNYEYHGKSFLRRWIFNLENNKGQDEFIRLRTDGKRTTVAYKLRKDNGTIKNTEEIEVETGNFERTKEFLDKILKAEQYYQENESERWTKGSVQVTIDRWPKVPPVMEVESDSEEEVRKVIKDLKIEGKEIGNISWEKVYGMYGMDIHSFKVLKF